MEREQKVVYMKEFEISQYSFMVFFFTVFILSIFTLKYSEYIILKHKNVSLFIMWSIVSF